MSTRLVALAGVAARPASWEQLLGEVVRVEFQVDVYRPQPGDPVLFGPTCAVAGCDARGLQRGDGLRGYLCQAHAVMWRRDGQPAQEAWLKEGARSLRRGRAVAGCAAGGCRRSAHTHGLCQPHYGHYRRAGRPPRAAFIAAAPTVRSGVAQCRVAGCAFAAIVGEQLCDAHHKSYRWLRWRRGELDLERYLQHVDAGRDRGGPRFDLRGVGPLVALELGYALQCRKDARGAAITPLIFGQVGRWLRDRPVDSLLIGSDTAWARAAAERFSDRSRANPLGWLRFCRSSLQRLRDERHGGEVWTGTPGRPIALTSDGRYAHQPVRRIYFSDIEPGWLRELAKRWARYRITTTSKSPASVAVSTSSLRRFTGWLADRDALPSCPAQITRGLLEAYRAHVHTLTVSPMRRTGLLTDLKVFLDDVRLHDWAPGLPANATYYRGEIPNKTSVLPRFIDEFVMGQIDNDENWTSPASVDTG
jgi:hypothetical protein